MALDVGEKIHVIERRRFDTDLRRHFFGIVERVTESTIRAVGYVFVYDPGTATYLRSTHLRTRVIPLASDGLIINVAPESTSVEAVRYEESAGRLVVTDGAEFTIDINEFGRNR